MIVAHDLLKTFRSRSGSPVVALDHIDLRVGQGELVGIVGPSGSGKSTLLFTLGGLLEPDEGSVQVAGRDLYAFGAVERARIRRRNIGFVFQTFNLIPYLECEQNVMLPMLLEGKGRKEAHARACSLLDDLGLEARRRHRPEELSVGERQRVAIARALANDPKVILADEPTGNLDADLGMQVFERLVGLARSGLSVVMVTHDLALAERCDRVIHLEAGLLGTGGVGNAA